LEYQANYTRNDPSTQKKRKAGSHYSKEYHDTKLPTIKTEQSFLYFYERILTMAKHTKKKSEPVSPHTSPAPSEPAKSVSETGWFTIQRQLIVLVSLCVLLYANTFRHGFAFDDSMAIVYNEHVQSGVGGIPKILTTDAFQSYLEHKGGSNQLGGGRYRPLSLITFALEQQFMGARDPDEVRAQLSPADEATRDAQISTEMHVRHVVNVLLYACLIVAIFGMLRLILPPGLPFLPFVATLLFLVHPIHTEVVANVKSRDEILSLLFICLTFTQYIKYIRQHQTKNLVLALFCFFGALLSKEYAITLVLLLPVFHFLFSGKPFRSSALALLFFAVPLGIYLAMRLSAISGPSEGATQNIMNYPYLYATRVQQIATEIAVIGRYAGLLLLPLTLRVDYSFAQIPYTTFADPLVWLSLIIIAGWFIATIWAIRKRHFSGFALAFLGINLALVSNILFNIGAPMGERLAFHSSLGLCILLAWLLIWATRRMSAEPSHNMALIAVLSVVVLAGSARTLNRNEDWKDNTTLFLHDVRYTPNSVLVNNDAAAACMAVARQTKDTAERRQWMDSAIVYYNQAIKLHPVYTLAYLNRGLCYFNTGNPEKALSDWDTVRVQNPAQPNLAKYLGIATKFFMSHGLRDAQSGNSQLAMKEFHLATNAAPESVDAWMNLGILRYNVSDIEGARKAFEQVLRLAPGNKDATEWLSKTAIR
jgi:protein O-mannosyl-transferase